VHGKARARDDGTAYRWWAEVSGADQARRPPTVVLILIHDLQEGGYLLEGYDRDGRETASVWHGAIASAKDWAASEHAPADVGIWHPIPNSIRDAATYARRQLR
jgi:hypothetical protein